MTPQSHCHILKISEIRARRGAFLPKLLEKVRQELLDVHGDQLIEKEHTGCQVLLREVMLDDLLFMYKLFFKVGNGLKRVSRVFKEHVTSEGMELVKQSEDIVDEGACLCLPSYGAAWQVHDSCKYMLPELYPFFTKHRECHLKCSSIRELLAASVQNCWQEWRRW